MNLVERFKNGDIAVHCDTEVKASKFVTWCFENGMRWEDKDDCATKYHLFSKDTVYYHGCDSNYLYVTARDMLYGWTYGLSILGIDAHYNICTYDDFMEDVENMKEFVLNDLEAGKHVVETRKGEKYLVCTAQEQLVAVGSDGWI